MISGFVVLCFSLGLTEGGYDRIIDVFTSLNTGHIQILEKSYLNRPNLYKTIDHPEKIISQLDQKHVINASSVRVEAGGLAFFKGKTIGAKIIGIEPSREPNLSSLHKRLENGSWLPKENSFDSIIGEKIARRLDIKLEDKFAVLSQAADGSISTEMFSVRGILRPNVFDDYSIFTNIRSIDQFLNLRGKVHRIVVKGNSFKEANKLKNLIANEIKLPDSLKIFEWNEIEADFFKAMNADKAGNIILYIIIGSVVSLGTLNTILMSLLERRREFGIMRALGTKPHQIITLILIEIMLLSTFSVIAGSIISLSINYYFSKYGISFPEPIEFGGIYIEEMISTSRLSILIGPTTLVYSCALLASIIPATMTAMKSPYESMRAK